MKTDHKKFKEANERVAEVEAEAEESQKPSARIKGSFGKYWHYRNSIADYTVLNLKIEAIIDYLDEQYEKEAHERSVL